MAMDSQTSLHSKGMVQEMIREMMEIEYPKLLYMDQIGFLRSQILSVEVGIISTLLNKILPWIIGTTSK